MFRFLSDVRDGKKEEWANGVLTDDKSNWFSVGYVQAINELLELESADIDGFYQAGRVQGAD